MRRSELRELSRLWDDVDAGERPADVDAGERPAALIEAWFARFEAGSSKLAKKLAWAYPAATLDARQALSRVLSGALSVGVYADAEDMSRAYAACRSCMQSEADSAAAYYAQAGAAVAVLTDGGAIVARCIVWDGNRAPKAYGPESHALIVLLDAAGLEPADSPLTADEGLRVFVPAMPKADRTRLIHAKVGHAEYVTTLTDFGRSWPRGSVPTYEEYTRMYTGYWKVTVERVTYTGHVGSVRPYQRFKPHIRRCAWGPYRDLMSHDNAVPKTAGV